MLTDLVALKYHPDRNPGREAEVNPKFQVIQSAHEILTDETQKRQYDEARRAHPARYPGASGVRGNPWQDAAKAYPPPPKRQPNTQTRPTSGAQRYETFTSSMPRHARSQAPKDDPQFRRNNAEAWDHLRPNSTRKNTQPRPSTPGRAPPGRAPTSAARDSRPGPAPFAPQTAYQKKKAEAAFGTSKKTGFTPMTPGVADEPPVTNKNYFTNRTHSNLFTEPDNMPEPFSQPIFDSDPLARFKDQFLDTRQRTPYHTPGGEKTSLFDSGPGLGRSTSTRTPPRAYEMPGAFPHTRPRSSSPARASSNDASSEDSSKAKTGADRAANRTKTAAPSKAEERYKPKVPTGVEIPPQSATAFPGKPYTRPTNNNRVPTNKLLVEPVSNPDVPKPNGRGPSVYASQTLPTKFQSKFGTAAFQSGIPGRRERRTAGSSSRASGDNLRGASSEEKRPHDFTTLLPLEQYQRQTLDHLVRNSAKADKRGGENGRQADEKLPKVSSNSMANNEKAHANSHRGSSFSLPDDINTGDTGTGYKAFTRNSTENINTRFVDHEMFDDWEFKAGSASANEGAAPVRPRPQSRNRPTRRQTPLSKPSLPKRVPQSQEMPAETNPTETNAGKQGFSAGAWNEQIGPQHFEPQPMNSAPTSPTRRPNLKNSKSFKMTAGTAAVVDEDESEGGQEADLPPETPAAGRTSTVPDAMDIDTPPVEKTEDITKPGNPNTARKYSTEPHRPDWRAGDINGVAPNAAGPPSSMDGTKEPRTEASGVPAGGSEDTDEFLTTFADFKKVEPFTDPLPSGLKSFADLRSTLPFESQPSERIPSDIKPPPAPLEFPPCPVAPRLPPTMGVAGLRPNNASFRKYAQDFNNYLSRWETFNDKVLTHFTTRQAEYKLRCLRRGANWLEDVAPDYLTELDQDFDVQKKYADACAEHRKRIAEFIEFRDRVK